MQMDSNTPLSKVRDSVMLLIALDIDFVESSALTAKNVESAFLKLITQINDKVQSQYFNDRLETFNYFGS